MTGISRRTALKVAVATGVGASAGRFALATTTTSVSAQDDSGPIKIKLEYGEGVQRMATAPAADPPDPEAAQGKFKQESDATDEAYVWVTDPYFNSRIKTKKEGTKHLLYRLEIVGCRPVLFVVKNGLEEKNGKTPVQLIKEKNSLQEIEKGMKAEFGYCCLECNGVLYCDYNLCIECNGFLICCTPPVE